MDHLEFTFWLQRIYESPAYLGMGHAGSKHLSGDFVTPRYPNYFSSNLPPLHCHVGRFASRYGPYHYACSGPGQNLPEFCKRGGFYKRFILYSDGRGVLRGGTIKYPLRSYSNGRNHRYGPDTRFYRLYPALL